MKAKVSVDAGVCGFKAVIKATTDDGMHVDFDIVSACEIIKELADLYQEKTPINAYQDISQQNESVILEISRQVLMQKGCCEACVVPAGVCKAMHVVAGLALPKDIAMKVVKD